MNRSQMPELPAPVQGTDSTIIDRPAADLWPLIADSQQLTKWGPPVVSVTVLDTPEQVGSRRTIEAKFGRKEGRDRPGGQKGGRKQATAGSAEHLSDRTAGPARCGGCGAAVEGQNRRAKKGTNPITPRRHSRLDHGPWAVRIKSVTPGPVTGPCSCCP